MPRGKYGGQVRASHTSSRTKRVTNRQRFEYLSPNDGFFDDLLLIGCLLPTIYRSRAYLHTIISQQNSLLLKILYASLSEALLPPLLPTLVSVSFSLFLSVSVFLKNCLHGDISITKFIEMVQRNRS